MKKALITVVLLVMFFSLKAQTPDTTVYESCTLATDQPTIDGGPGFDSCPQFQSGVIDLDKYISDHIHYPKNVSESQTETRVIISMIIEQDGSISHATIERGVSEYMNKEALRVINSLPKWKPGILHGRPARVKYSLAVSFKLNKNPN